MSHMTTSNNTSVGNGSIDDGKNSGYGFNLNYSAPVDQISARKLAASLWRIRYQPPTTFAKTRRSLKDKPLQPPSFKHHDPQHDLEAEGIGSLRRLVATSLTQHHIAAERRGRDILPVSPVSCTSESLQIAAYDCQVSPPSSLDLKRRLGLSSFSLKTSTQLINVLNRIWNLEEQHASNISLIKSLKKELSHAQSHIWKLMREQQADRETVDNLLKQVAEDKLVMMNKEQDKIKAAVQSERDKLEGERRLRHRLESRHRKLEQEFAEVKLAFSKAMKELGGEKEARVSLEDLCDEFAGEIRYYEQKMQALKLKSGANFDEGDDQLILRLADEWLYMRGSHARLSEAESDLTATNMAVEKIRCEIKTYLEANKLICSKFGSPNHVEAECQGNACFPFRLLESVHLQAAVSTPYQDCAGESSFASDGNCSVLERNLNDGKTNIISKPHQDRTKQGHIGEMRTFCSVKLGSNEMMKGTNLSSKCIQFKEHMYWTQGSHKDEGGNCKPKEGDQGKKSRQDGARRRTRAVDDLIGSHLLLSECEKVYEDDHFSWRDHSVMGSRGDIACDGFGPSSPVQQRNFRHASPDFTLSEHSSKWRSDCNLQYNA